MSLWPVARPFLFGGGVCKQWSNNSTDFKILTCKDFPDPIHSPSNCYEQHKKSVLFMSHDFMTPLSEVMWFYDLPDFSDPRTLIIIDGPLRGPCLCVRSMCWIYVDLYNFWLITMQHIQHFHGNNFCLEMLGKYAKGLKKKKPQNGFKGRFANWMLHRYKQYVVFPVSYFEPDSELFHLGVQDFFQSNPPSPRISNGIALRRFWKLCTVLWKNSQGWLTDLCNDLIT